jgi:hypothetical protein
MARAKLRVERKLPAVSHEVQVAAVGEPGSKSWYASQLGFAIFVRSTRTGVVGTPTDLAISPASSLFRRQRAAGFDWHPG